MKETYINRRKKASVLVILCSVLMNIKNDRADMTKKTRPINIEAGLVICIGHIMETTPKTRVDVIIVAPIRSPRISQSSLFLAALMTKAISGIELPKLMIKTPTRVKGMLKKSEKNKEDLITP